MLSTGTIVKVIYTDQAPMDLREWLLEREESRFRVHSSTEDGQCIIITMDTLVPTTFTCPAHALKVLSPVGVGGFVRIKADALNFKYGANDDMIAWRHGKTILKVMSITDTIVRAGVEHRAFNFSPNELERVTVSTMPENPTAETVLEDLQVTPNPAAFTSSWATADMMKKPTPPKRKSPQPEEDSFWI